MPGKLKHVATEDNCCAAESESLRRKLAELDMASNDGIEELLRLMRRNRTIAWAAVLALETKGSIGLALSFVGDGEWWLSASSAAAGVGLGGLLIAPNAIKLFAELKRISSLTAKFTARARSGE
jgi:hypothetical protein